MANQIDNSNTIAIASIAKLNGLTDAQMEKVNTLEWTGLVQAGAYSTATSTLSTARTRCAGFGVARNASGTKLVSTEEYGGDGSIGSGGNLATARMAPTACGSQTAGLLIGGTT